jgi:hypothetical protein
MPGSYDICSAERLVHCRFEGEISASDCVRLMDQILHDPRYREGYNCLVDNRGITGAFSRRELEQVIPAVVRTFKAMAARPKVAVVAGNEVQYGVSRMFQILVDDVLNLNLRVFRDHAEAVAWLSERGTADEAASRS